MNNNYTGEGICSMLMAVSTILQTNQFLQNIQILVCIIAGILGIVLTLIRLIKLYKLAKKDGKITNDEREAMAAEILELTEQIKDLEKDADSLNKVNEETK